ncbi:MAG TPA: tetratricopeptide repeat protein [Methylomirabilota bacterium]|nr:tetratricopeptide repeat protein [Methylomirabilota bacterium]
METASQQKLRKRRIKRAVLKERSKPPVRLGATAPPDIPIEILDAGQGVLHAASEEDVRAVLSRMPDAAWQGISRIQLSLGKAYQEERSTGEPQSITDPIIGRLGSQLFPGVYCGNVLGTYLPSRGLVSVYAFVVDPSKSPLPTAARDVYLKLHALGTFVHEVAHHHDNTARVARGRWLADRKENFENYAERMEHQWTREIVVPYLEATYKPEVNELLSWVEHHGGIRLSLTFLADDPRRTERDGHVRLVFSSADAFQLWVGEFPGCKSVHESRYAFAEQLHYADAYVECLQILESLLKDNPEDTRSLVWKADTLIHLDRSAEAEDIVNAVLGSFPGHEAALELRGKLLEARKQWGELLEHSMRFFACTTVKSKFRKYALMQRAVALCALERDEELQAVISEIVQEHPTRSPYVTRRIFGRAGRALA